MASLPRFAALVALTACSLLPVAATAQEGPCSVPFSITHSFPTTGPERTRWEITGCTRPQYGLVIGTTRFWKSPTSSLQLFHDARVSEIFVVYHDNSARFYDIEESFGAMPLGDVECPATLGSRLAQNTVCAEVRDRGLAWKDGTGARRGEELVLWGVINVGTYKYVMEWRFRDDGVVMGRVGATGRNLAAVHHVAHTHSVTWRLDIDLDGPDGDSVRIGKHLEPAGSLTAEEREVLVARERGIVWTPAQFTTLNISDATLVNGQGKRSSYNVVPERFGTARHVEAHSKQDFWVTRVGVKGAELRTRELPTYINPAEVVTATDIVVWYTGSILHVERDEDDNGPTQVMWVGFTLKPHDVFDASPLYP